ncbi:alpha/beta hydrolase, partial [Aliiglaciecola sp.]|nr:alpha/beta hydrolase [Aliiglaciecola sp.]
MQQITLPTIFLPGTQCDERIWMPVWKRLNCTNRSYVPLQWAETLEQMLALTQDRVDSFEGKVNLVGYSMGGYIASLVAKANPDKINALTLIGYDPNGLDKQELSNRKLLIKSIANGQKVPF